MHTQSTPIRWSRIIAGIAVILLLAVPCLIRAVVQGPIWLAGNSGAMDADAAVAALGILKIALGWPLQLAALAAMLWLLGRNRTPLQTSVI